MAGYLVIGLGTFGRSIAQTLYENGKMVLAIDQQEERVQKVIDDEIASDAITLDVTDENSIKKVVNDDFNTAFVCIGKNTQSSVFITVILKEIGIKTIICKAKNELQGKILKKIGATSVVYPEETMAKETALGVIRPNITEHFKFSEKYRMFEIKAPKDFVGKNLIELNLRNKYEMNIIGIKSKEELNIMPLPNTAISESDILLVIANIEKMALFWKKYNL
ncbi:potassium channel family protein [Leptotrichia buccalis]|jgi:trkA-N domain protein|uniref:TrkA-N domain protein n=1 Tax=Leptotrichia buccalis (strain ATCC 14201 / DSM 1135 / JCM 12969 / NCTC 10249 / C-1013-b) TaxID=523794 RepID=C7NEH8_LEPBD|nr:TrkA family potassium uptake protein [Leptotrichia buccalis]ACV38339.1 TrkA-N domain protein [Leptotrichia buccalis C-1013-b]